MEQIEDRDLIQQVRAGDERAFAVLIHRHSRRVYAHVSRLVRLSDDVDDLVQIVFVKVFRNLDQLRNPDQFQAWLHQLVRNAVYSWHRRQVVQMRFEDAFESTRETSEDLEDERHLMIRSALRVLSREHREVIAHHYLKGYSYAETATLLDVTVDTVRGRLKRARVRLKKELETMVEIEKQMIALNREDLVFLNKVKAFVSDDEKRPILQGLCLDVGGRVVATNGHVLLVRTSERLEAITAPVILGPWADVDLPIVDRATLVFDETKAVIQIPGQRDVIVPLIEGPFVHYETVIPAEDPEMRFSVKSELLLNALDLLCDQMEVRHPVSGDWEYKAQVELHLSSVAKTLTFVVSRNLGYRRLIGEGKTQSFSESGEAVSPGGLVDWVFQVPVLGNLDVLGEEETLRIGVDFMYFKNMVHALGIEDLEEMVLEFRGPLKAIMFLAPTQPNWKGLLMPLRLIPENKDE